MHSRRRDENWQGLGMREMIARCGRPRRGAGFTLVELMIAMALVGALTAMIYGLFARTSDSLTDVEGASHALDTARFALVHVRNDIQAAGSQGSPNSQVDPWVRPADAGQNVHGIYVYNGWQNSRAAYSGAATDLAAENPQSAFSGIVVLGAYDFPQSFFVDNLNEGAQSVNIPNNERGMGRLIGVDAFNVDVQEDVLDNSFVASRIAQDMNTRVMRLSDTDGFFQFVPVTSASIAPNSDGTIQAAGLRFRDEGAGETFGLAATTEEDVNFDVGLLDAYWYRVRLDPNDDTNFQLVRQRVNAGALITHAGALDEGDLLGMTVPNSTLIIADRVVDFRLWFECAQDTGGGVTMDWQGGNWDVENDAAGDCLSNNLATTATHQARMAHIRLSIRTDRENSNRPHLNVAGAAWRGFEEPEGQMVTYNVAPHARGSAGVVTVQTSVELTNFALRGLR